MPAKLDKELGNGGAWLSGDMTHRSASRGCNHRNLQDSNLGFRLVREEEN